MRARRTGKIWFDHVSLKAVSTGAAGTRNLPPGLAPRGFEVTAESLQQLQRVQTIGDELVKYARQGLGTQARLRKEVFAQAAGRFQVVLLLYGRV